MVKNKGYVFAYINPDTDGVCSSIGYSYYKYATVGDEYIPIIFGNLNSETLFVLEYFNVHVPINVSTIDTDTRIVIVDTHHKSQLPVNIPFENVVEVFDHHPAGDVDAFPNAKIQNEEIGAVATLITEKIKSASLKPDTKIAGLLAAAIISNTLNFSAPSTSDRDKLALRWLQSYVNIDREFINSMFETRSNISQMSTEEAILSDYKEFVIGNIKIGISQLETTDLPNFIARSDLISCLTKLKKSLKLEHLIFNGIDILQHNSIVVVAEPKTKKILEAALRGRFDGAIAKFPRILLRKTDFIPQLKILLENG